MKKIFFSFAAILFAATTFAQGIVLEHTFNGLVGASSLGVSMANTLGNQPKVDDFDDCFFSLSGTTLSWWDENYTQHNIAVAAPTQEGEFEDRYVVTAAQNIFTNDNRMCFLLYEVIWGRDGASDVLTLYVYDELGTLVSSFTNDATTVSVVRMFGEYKLLAIGDTHTYVYSLPGQGKTATDNEIVQTAPRRGRKYIQDAQVLVEENDHTYNMTGLQIK